MAQAEVSKVLEDRDRLVAVRLLGLLDRPAPRSLDRLTALAAQLLECPIALLTLVDADRQFFVSSYGLPEALRCARQTPLGYSICQYAVATGKPLVVRDARMDPVLAANPAVTALGVTAYAGIPLITSECHAVGTLCVLDVAPRDWRDDQLELLADLSEIVIDEMQSLRLEHGQRFDTEWHGSLPGTRPEDS